jgi:alpha-tubulin suppressor-like RCC1 family protein
MSGGTVKCWGGSGGNGTTTPYVPIDMPGLIGVSNIAAGYSHTCAVTTGGGVKCWGTEALGTMTTVSSAVPVDVVGLSSGVSAVTAGYQFSCALMTSGGVKCWGLNSSGQLGNDDPLTAAHLPNYWDPSNSWDWNGYPTPLDVLQLSGVSSLSGGWAHTCALLQGGEVKCWGQNNHFQVGASPQTNRMLPVTAFASGSGISAMTGGELHTCALTTGGGVKCWGAAPQLGTNSASDSLVAWDVVGLTSGVSAIAAGALYTCAIVAGGVKCWGNVSPYTILPADLPGLGSGVSAIAAGESHACVLTTSGNVKCWGANDHGQLGTNNTTASSVPVEPMGL